MDLGGALRAARQAAGKSLSEMSALTFFTSAYLSQLETGKREVLPRHVAAYEEALEARINFTTSQITMTDVALLADLTSVVAKSGLRHGGLAVAEMAKANWNWTEELLGRSAPDDVRIALNSQAAQLADRLAWTLGDVGQSDRAVKYYKKALALAADDTHVRDVVTVSFAGHLINHKQPRAALTLLDGVRNGLPVVSFTAHAARAEAFAYFGRWEETVREVGLADEAHANVDMSQLPATHSPYASGHAAHAHRSAGTALYVLARRGEARAAKRALQRLSEAVQLFGPDRARTVAKCETLMSTLS